MIPDENTSYFIASFDYVTPPQFTFTKIELNTKKSYLKRFVNINYITNLITFDGIALDEYKYGFDGKTFYCFMIKTDTNYTFRAFSTDNQVSLTKDLGVNTGRDEYVGIKWNYHHMVWIEKTAYVHLLNGT